LFTILATGQHTDLFTDTGLADEFPVTPLNVANWGVPDQFIPQVREKLQQVYYECSEHVVLVQGDTASAYAGGLWASKDSKWPLVHLEAGLRTHDLTDPCPEEGYRVALDAWAHLCLAPTTLAAQALMDEGHEKKIEIVGNSVVDALLALPVHPVPACCRSRTVLVTLHRRESFGQPLEDIVQGLMEVALEYNTRHGFIFRWPAHPNPNVQQVANRCKDTINSLKTLHNLWIEPPMTYPRFVRTLATARMVLTDSGGVIEESTTLGIPCVIARTKTERMESVHSHHAILAGKTTEGVAEALRKALTGSLKVIPANTYGYGDTSTHVVNALEERYH